MVVDLLEQEWVDEWMDGWMAEIFCPYQQYFSHICYQGIGVVMLKGCVEWIDFFALLFYVHDKHLRSCRDGQLT